MKENVGKFELDASHLLKHIRVVSIFEGAREHLEINLPPRTMEINQISILYRKRIHYSALWPSFVKRAQPSLKSLHNMRIFQIISLASSHD